MAFSIRQVRRRHGDGAAELEKMKGRKRRGSFGINYANEFDCVSFAHALFVLLTGSVLILIESPHMRFWAWNKWLMAPTSYSQKVLFVTSASFYLYDALVILATRTLHRREVGILFHHLICIAALTSTTVTGKDGTIVLFGLVLGELSNPPRLLCQITSRLHKPKLSGGDETIRRMLQPLGVMTNPKSTQRLLFAHFGIFVFTRILYVHYTAHTVIPSAALAVTKICTISMLLFSALAIWEFAIQKDNRRFNNGVLFM